MTGNVITNKLNERVYLLNASQENSFFTFDTTTKLNYKARLFLKNHIMFFRYEHLNLNEKDQHEHI